MHQLVSHVEGFHFAVFSTSAVVNIAGYAIRICVEQVSGREHSSLFVVGRRGLREKGRWAERSKKRIGAFEMALRTNQSPMLLTRAPDATSLPRNTCDWQQSTMASGLASQPAPKCSRSWTVLDFLSVDSNQP